MYVCVSVHVFVVHVCFLFACVSAKYVVWPVCVVCVPLCMCVPLCVCPLVVILFVPCCHVLVYLVVMWFGPCCHVMCTILPGMLYMYVCMYIYLYVCTCGLSIYMCVP